MEFRVIISDYKIAKSPDSLVTIGLGSCIGIALYDKKTKIAGLAHIMLPLSKDFKDTRNLYKFADTCITMLVKGMIDMGCSKRDLTAKIAGGANMFKVEGETIGDKNARAVLDTLKELNIPVLSSDLGGNAGRTLTIYAESGDVYVKKIGENKYLL